MRDVFQIVFFIFFHYIIRGWSKLELEYSLSHNMTRKIHVCNCVIPVTEIRAIFKRTKEGDISIRKYPDLGDFSSKIPNISIKT